jgi:predicted nucleic acid-binding protein
MSVWVDTSALVALLDTRDPNHARAHAIWERLRGGRPVLVTGNYVVAEAVAVLQRRLGMDAVDTLVDDILPAVTVAWVDGAVHAAAINSLRAARRRGLSLVDCISFEQMRRLGITAAFAFDPHFEEQGFHCLGEREVT